MSLGNYISIKTLEEQIRNSQNVTSLIELRQLAFDKCCIMLLTTKIMIKVMTIRLRNLIISMVGLYLTVLIYIVISIYLTFSRYLIISIYITSFCSYRNLVSNYHNTSLHKLFEQLINRGQNKKSEIKTENMLLNE